MKFSTYLIFLSGVLGVFANTPAQVMADMASISSSATKLNDDVNAMTNWDLKTAWNIHTAARELVTALDLATSNVKVATMIAISSEDIQAALTAADNLRTIIVKALEDLMDKKDVISDMPVYGAVILVRQDLEVIKMSAEGFQAALLAGIPNELKGVANGIIKDVSDTIAAAISVFS